MELGSGRDPAKKYGVGSIPLTSRANLSFFGSFRGCGSSPLSCAFSPSWSGSFLLAQTDTSSGVKRRDHVTMLFSQCAWVTPVSTRMVTDPNTQSRIFLRRWSACLAKVMRASAFYQQFQARSGRQLLNGQFKNSLLVKPFDLLQAARRQRHGVGLN